MRPPFIHQTTAHRTSVPKTPDLPPGFAASRLVRLLAPWAPVQRDAGMDVAERASLWFSAFDAIRLQAVHQSIRGVQAKPADDARGVDASVVGGEMQRVRAGLAKAIAQEVLEPQSAPDFKAYHRRHLELQRTMEVAIAPLREHVRHAVARASVRLRRLATLDEAMEQVIAAREQAVLPTVAALLERRFALLHSEAARPDDLAAMRRPGGWLHAFEAEWRQALLCELDLRLEPVTGLLEALAHDTGH